MLFEAILMWLTLGSAVFLIGIPVFKLVKAVLPKREKNPLAEAKVRLEHARLEVEAAKLNKEAEKLYDDIYKDALAEDEAIEDEQQHNQERK